LIGIVVPCYNEEKRLDLEAFRKFSGSEKDCFILFVNDGSTDNTESVLSDLCAENSNLNYISLEKNSGKAEAIRQGILSFKNSENDLKYIGFMDADLSTPLSEIELLDTVVAQYHNPAALFGSRVKLFGSTQIKRSAFRHYIGRVIATFISLSLEIGFYDTQCGFKFFRKDVIDDLFEEKFISRWLFDVEIIFRLKRMFGDRDLEKQLIEFSLTEWTEDGESKIPLGYAFRLPLDLLRIHSYYRK
jgi:dolichyl-phosphate beta-glucosyltransferase